ncbi:MAG: UvrD-helicase domain-containing protein [Nibricoccus sp.]
MKALQHTLIRASAGTGKTYQLAVRFIALLFLQKKLSGRFAPERIIAVTFTRKGAGEFTQRIVEMLASAAMEPVKFERLRKDVHVLVEGDPASGTRGILPGASLEITPELLRDALVEIINRLDCLALGTIDSFMAKAVQTLAFELGLGAFEILPEAIAASQREQLLGYVVNSSSPEEAGEFQQAIKRAVLKSSASWRYEMDRIIGDCHGLLLDLRRSDAGGDDLEGWGGSRFWAATVPSAAGDGWRTAALELRRELDENSFSNKRVSNGIIGALEWLLNRETGAAGSPPTWLDDDGQLCRLWANWPPEHWDCFPTISSKTPCKVSAPLMRRLREILRGWLNAECSGLVAKSQGLCSVVSRYENVYDLQARRRGRLSFGDLPRLLDPAFHPENISVELNFLWYRWHQRFDHWLLDEFQDTSRAQWSVIQPCVDEAIQDDSGTKSVFVVGDSKQSIYAWRGGEPRLFEDLRSRYNVIEERSMSQSFRSRPAVLELVNCVCDPANNPSLLEETSFPAAARDRWYFEQHSSAPHRASAPGYSVVLQVAKGSETSGASLGSEADDEGNEKLSAQSAAILAALRKVKPLERGLSCAILVRKGRHAMAVADWLRAHGEQRVMVEGDVTLAEQAPVVAAIVDALRWLQAPSHAFGLGHVQLTPLWSVLTVPLSPETGESNVWRYWMQEIVKEGAARVTAKWCVALASQTQGLYLRHCLAALHDFAKQTGGTLSLAEWERAIDQFSVRESSAPGFIHVMTIHKSKGLGFDVVFLPDLDLGGSSPASLLVRRDEHGVPQGCLARPPSWLRAWMLELKTIAQSEHADHRLEALCVLYVALTRAGEATFVILDEKKPHVSSPARDWILRGVEKQPAASSAFWDGAMTLWESGDPAFAEHIALHDESSVIHEPIVLSAPVSRPRRRRPSDAGHAVVQLSVAAGTSSSEAMAFGSSVHEVFEQIEWFEPELELKGNSQAIQVVNTCLANDEIRRLFTQEHRNDEAHRELPVELWEAGEWWSGVIDRLVLRRAADGSVVKAVIVDFKTDAVDSPAILIERYASQVAVYQRALKASMDLAADQISVVLVSSCLNQVITL